MPDRVSFSGFGFGCGIMIPTGQTKFALVIAEQPEFATLTPDPEQLWAKFLSSIQRMPKPFPNTETIHENVWLIPLTTELPLLNKLVEWAASFHIRLYIQFLDEKPEWIKYPPDEPAEP